MEEAVALRSLADTEGYTQVQLAKRLGRSQAYVAEVLSLLKLPKAIQDDYRTSDNVSKSQLVQVVREKNPAKKQALWDAVKSGSYTVQETRKARGKPTKKGKAKPISKQIALESPRATVTVKFQKTRASGEEILRALQEAVKAWRKELREQ